jgi:hypothetical protein
MIRTAILACALVAVPSAALAQSQVVLPEVRMLRLPAAAADDGPPEDYIFNMAPEYNGWIYQEINGSPNPARPGMTPLYRGEGYPATIMVCPKLTSVTLRLGNGEEVVFANNRCGTVTTDTLDVRTSARVEIPIRYRILAVHRAAD